MNTVTVTTPAATGRWQDYHRKVDPVYDTTLRWNDILRITGLKKSQAKLKIANGEFPAPFPISDTGRSLGWHSSEVSAWCAARDALREAMKSQPRTTPFRNTALNTAALKKRVAKKKKKAVRR